MLSTLAVRKGLSSLPRVLKLKVVPIRGCATAVVSKDDNYELLPNEEFIPRHEPYPVTLEQQIKHWDEANEIFFGKERDFKNFPHPEYILESPPTNFGVVPTSWCKNVYEKLGVSGVYTIFLGTILSLQSKELLFHDAHGIEMFSRALIFCVLLTKVAPFLKKYLEEIIQEEREEVYDEPVQNAKLFTASNIEVAKNSIWRMEAVGDIYAAKKEMVDLQLESVYRQRLHQIHKEVKEKLDYQVDMLTLQRKFQQANMVSWIVGQVQKSITPQMEKDNIKSCIANLSVLAKQA